MDSVSVKPSALNTHHKSKFAIKIAKVLNLRSVAAGIASATVVVVDGEPKKPSKELGIHFQTRDSFSSAADSGSSSDELAIEAMLAKIFAAVSAVKSGYAHLQFSQSPYDPNGISSADQKVVKELKCLSELKLCYLKKQFVSSPEISLIKAEIKEQKSLLKTYEITAKKLEIQSKLKDSELVFLREKLDEVNKQNMILEKRLTQSGQLLSALDNLHISGLNPSHFVTVLRQTVKSVRSFARVLSNEMRLADWDFGAVMGAIQPGVVLRREEHQRFALESFASREMFDGFCHSSFHNPTENHHRRSSRHREKFFTQFMDLKSADTKEYLLSKPRSAFVSFCRIKYSKLVHPKMESSFHGDLETRNFVQSGEFSRLKFSDFFASFAEMAKKVWLLHCLAFSFEPEASIFQIRRGCRFSEVYMESIVEEFFPGNNECHYSQVGFTVIPGFRIGKTVLQSKVYLTQVNPDR